MSVRLPAAAPSPTADPDLGAELTAARMAVTSAHLERLRALGVLRALFDLGHYAHAFGVVEAERIAPGRYAPHPLGTGRGKPHIVMPVFEKYRLIDLVAWQTTAPAFWLRRTGEGWAIDADDIDILDRRGRGPLLLNPTPLAWLRGGARGSVVLDWTSPKAERLRWHDEVCCETAPLAAMLHCRMTHAVRLPDITLAPEAPMAFDPSAPRARPVRDLVRRSGITASALFAKGFVPIRYVVKGYIAEGATLLAGAPKIGKSWMALNIAVAIASGRPVFGTIPCTAGDVLYLALEDNQRRLKSRLLTMGVAAPERLTFMTEWPALDADCIEEMEAWIADSANPALIVVDVLTKIRPATRDNAPLYEGDYRALGGLQRLAGAHGIAVLILHHTRKMEAEDPFDSVSGTRGLTGAADTVLVLKRDMVGGRTVLYGRGRDVQEIETAFEFRNASGTWGIIGEAHEVAKTNERQVILDILKASATPLTAREVSDLSGGGYQTVRRTLTRMAAANEIERTRLGLYACLTCLTVSTRLFSESETGETGETGYREES